MLAYFNQHIVEPAWKIDFIEGNVNSYSRLLNNPKRLEAIKDHAQLVATVAEVSAEADDEKARKELRREKKEGCFGWKRSKEDGRDASTFEFRCKQAYKQVKRNWTQWSQVKII